MLKSETSEDHVIARQSRGNIQQSKITFGYEILPQISGQNNLSVKDNHS
jgi:hypothetical protein